ncbi:hypothetical protein [Amycolatopsis pigmentata]|uniref:Uncharacterized protein n=1 Tax=Amycolatopsis pigmentata TaxID=450801 RepID=A0ABW5FVT6_9PSEU
MNIDDDAEHGWANTLLSRAVGPEPELGFRAEDVLAKARRDLAWRRAALTGTLTVAALVATAVLLGHGSSPEPRTPANGGPTATSTAPSPPTETTVYGVEGPLVIDARSKDLTAKLADAHALPPGVTASTGKYYGGDPLVFYKLPIGQNANSYYAYATLTDSHGQGHLSVHLLNQQTGTNCVGKPDPRVCSTEVLPDGSRITAFRYAPDGTAVQWIVELVRPNGTAVDVLCGNWSMDGDTGGYLNNTKNEPPVPKDTLVRLAKLFV